MTGFVDDGQTGMHGVLRVVFTSRAIAEDGEQVVARVLEHPATVGGDDGAQAAQRAVHQQMQVFRVELAAHLGGADHIDEQHGDLLELRVGVGQSIGRGWPRQRQTLVQGCDGDVDCGISEQFTLRLQRDNGGGNLIGGFGHSLGSCNKAAGESGEL